MKNMDYEKKYNEALNWMRELYPGLHGATKEDAEHYFPELKESEDERIIEQIKFAVMQMSSDREDTKKECLAWLEKQKEQKPITINQDEKEFLADEITAFLCNYDKEFDGEDPVPSEVAEHFYLLGKQAQEQKPEAKLTGWVARDKDTEMLNLYMACPPRRYDFWAAPTDLHLPDKEFPDLKWEDEPMEVEITITKK